VYFRIDIATALVLTTINSNAARYRCCRSPISTKPPFLTSAETTLGKNRPFIRRRKNGQIEKAEQATIHSEEI